MSNWNIRGVDVLPLFQLLFSTDFVTSNTNVWTMDVQVLNYRTQLCEKCILVRDNWYYIPHLDYLVPTTGYNSWILSIWWEPDTTHPVCMTIVLLNRRHIVKYILLFIATPIECSFWLQVLRSIKHNIDRYHCVDRKSVV